MREASDLTKCVKIVKKVTNEIAKRSQRLKRRVYIWITTNAGSHTGTESTDKTLKKLPEPS